MWNAAMQNVEIVSLMLVGQVARAGVGSEKPTGGNMQSLSTTSCSHWGLSRT